MPYDVYGDLADLYSSRGIQVSDDYLETCRRCLAGGLAYSTPIMLGITQVMLGDNRLMAFNLHQNAIDEAKGAARVKLIAERFADGQLAEKMRRHVADEFKHSVQFRNLIKLAGEGAVSMVKIPADEVVSDVLDFEDDLRTFIARVHSIEIRSWTILRMYIDHIRLADEARTAKMISVLSDIMADEIQHVIYTGKQMSVWIEEDPGMARTLEECFNHTNRETWADMRSMLDYIAENHQLIWSSESGIRVAA